MNSFLPANIGTLVMLVMFTSVIAGATFAAIFSGFLVRRSFDLQHRGLPLSLLTVGLARSRSSSAAWQITKVLAILLIVGFGFLLVLTTRVFRRQWAKLREQLIVGGRILGSPRKALTGVFLPELGSYLARLAVIAVFLGAYSIPVTFHNVASVTASNSISNTVSLTPGGVGVTQAMNSAALSKETSANTATAYSASQQLIVSAWNVVFATALVLGLRLVRRQGAGHELHEEAKAKSQELRERRQTRDSPSTT
jgi:uncharacterized membrane protein YbhN (UPF0104 family)